MQMVALLLFCVKMASKWRQNKGNRRLRIKTRKSPFFVLRGDFEPKTAKYETSKNTGRRESSCRPEWKRGLVVVVAFDGVDGKDDHQNAQSVALVGNVQDIGVRPVENLLADRGNRSVAVANGIIPFNPIALDDPSRAIHGEAGSQKGKFFDDFSDFSSFFVEVKMREKAEDLLFQCSDMGAVSVGNVKEVSPCKFSFNGEKGSSVFVVNVIGIKPGKEALLKE